MDLTPDLVTIRNFALALLIGALMGVDREKHKAEEGHISVGGLRTFILIAAVGAMAAWMSAQLATPSVFAAALVCIAAGVFLGYHAHARQYPQSLGLTTEMAALAVFLLGGMTMVGHAALAVGLGIAGSAVLAYKQPLHGLVSKLGREDIYAGLRLLIATFIVLPLLPNEPIDPWQALNPYQLWLLVILIAGLSLIGYVATRWLGARRGTAITALTGGLVSSTAVTLTFARRSRVEKGASDALAGGMLLSWAVMFGRVVIEVAIVYAPLLSRLWLPFTAMAAATSAIAALLFLRGRPHVPTLENGQSVQLVNPFSLTAAARFAAFFAIVLIVIALVQRRYASEGLLVVAVLAGLTDVDAITLSMAEYGRASGAAELAAAAIVVATLSNTVVKAAMVLILAQSALRWRIGIATLLILAAGATPVLLNA
ncbi:MAG TPA: DUF4010 domain-containing protein [Burkholderiales bacterium]|nr:DUF4010 domain-containing protein [Burkholderiales bacterium]